MRVRRGLLFLVMLVVGGVLARVWLAGGSGSAATANGASVTEALSGGAGTEGFARALRPRPFVFPEDAGPHPAYQTEWWYYTGNLDGDDRGHYGYQLTVFRRALTPHAQKRPSSWGASQVYFAHFALTDVRRGAFVSDERWSRGAAGLAGARSAARGGGAAFDAWVESWSMRAEGDGAHLRADTPEASIDLVVTPEREVVAQGDHGLSHKSVDPANASYYYSIPRLRTTGTVTSAGRVVSVSGQSWLDREWSTSALSKDEVGWDWFALQLSDGRDIMLYHMRRRDGTLDPNSSGSVMTANGVKPLRLADVQVDVTSTWRSPHSKTAYPSSWRVRIPSEGLDLRVEPWAADQELQGAFRYWEGAVKITAADGRVNGNGYVELTGYADRLSGP